MVFYVFQVARPIARFAMKGRTQEKSPSAPSVDQVMAWLAVLLVHLVIGGWFFRSQSVSSRQAEHERTSVSFVAASQKPATEKRMHSPVRNPGIPPRHRSSPYAPPTTNVNLSASVVRNPIAEPMDAEAAALDASPPSAGGALVKEPAIFGSTSSRIFRESPQASRFRIPAERFKVKPQMTAELIVREFGRLAGLWPPGYTDDPCPGVNRTIEEGKSAGVTSDAERRLLADAMMVHQRFCQ